MAVSTPRAPALTDLEVMAHLYRRAGFGATHDELQAARARGYEATIEELLQPEAQPPPDEYVPGGQHPHVETISDRHQACAFLRAPDSARA
jgi:hypothetical protein